MGTIIKGRVSNIKEICKLVKMEGKDPLGSTTSLVDGALIMAVNDKVTTNVLSKTNSVLATLIYNKIDVIQNGEIPIGNISEFEDFLNRFDGNDIIRIEVLENRIKIIRENPKKIAYIPLTARENIDDSLRAEAGMQKLKQENNIWRMGSAILNTFIKVNSMYIKNVLDDGDIKSLNRRYPFIINNNQMICKVGSESGGMIETIIPTISIKSEGDVKTTFAGGIDNVFSNIDGDVSIYTSTNNPILVIKICDKYEVKYVIAPIEEG